MRFADFDAILFDMDGTLYREHHGLPGSSEVIEHLRRIRKPFACITNNSANTSDELSRRLAGMGVSIEAGAIYTACHAMADWIRRFPSKAAKPRVFNFAGNALPRELNGDAEFVESQDAPCDVVAVATHMRENSVPFDFERSLIGLNLLRQGAHLIVGCSDRVFPIRGGVEFGSGSWGQLFAFAGAVPPEHVCYAGKPEARFFLSLCERLRVESRKCLIVGDNLESDIQGGLNVGAKTAIVLTGITRRDDVAASRVQPHVVFEDLPQMLREMA